MNASNCKTPKRRFLTKKGIGLVLGGGLLLLLLTPRLVSSKRVYDPFVQSLAQDKLHLEVGEVYLRWFRPIEIRNVTISDIESADITPTSSDHTKGDHTKDGAPSIDATERTRLLTIRSIKTDRGLLAHLLSGRAIGRIEIIEPKVDISLIEDSSNLQRLIQSLNRAQNPNLAPPERSADHHSSPSNNADFPKLNFDLVVRDASIHVQKAGDATPLAVVPPFTLESEYRGLNSAPSLKVHKTKLLDQVELTQELVRLGLGKAIPLIAKSNWFDGRISLDIGELHIPLEDPLASTAAANIQMHQVRTGPSEPLLVNAVEMLAKFRNKPPALELVFVNDSNIQVTLAERRVHHEGLQVGFPKIDDRLQLTSSGSVGLADRSLDLLVAVPVPIEQLARRDAVKELGVPNIDVPIHGTLDQPEVDWTAMREDSGAILAMMAGKLQADAPVLSSVIGSLGGVAEGQADEAINATVDLLQSIRAARQKNKEGRDASIPAENQPSEQENKGSRRPVLDAIRGILEPSQP